MKKTKKNQVPKNVCPKILVQKKFGSRKIFWSQKIRRGFNCCHKQFLFKKDLGSKNLELGWVGLDQVGKKNLDQKKFGPKKNLGPKKNEALTRTCA